MKRYGHLIIALGMLGVVVSMVLQTIDTPRLAQVLVAVLAATQLGAHGVLFLLVNKPERLARFQERVAGK